MRLATWSPWRIAGVWLAWIALLACAAGVSVGFLLWRERQRTVYPVRSDIVVAATRQELWWGALLVIGPPLVVTLVWLWRRYAAR